MRSKAIFMALLAFAFGAQAVPVSVDQVKTAVRVWTGAGTRMGAYLGNQVESVSTVTSPEGFTCYLVRLARGGTLLMSDDSAFEPVIAFTSESLESIDVKSPLWALIKRDLAFRRKSMGGPKSGAQSFQSGVPENPRWAALFSAANAKPSVAPGLDAAADPIQQDDNTVIDDLRVGILVRTKWGQSRMSGMDCCNYYTPNNYVCGCVATALAQTMRYHKWPQDPIASFTGNCTCDGTPQTYTIESGAFDWGNMPEKAVTSERQCQAIGRLTFACGVAVEMEYSKSGSSAVTSDVIGALKKRFGYASAIWGQVASARDYEKNVYASLDAGCPVVFSICFYDEEGVRSSGHAVVGDGYGYNTVDGIRTPYVHLNMGWNAQNDWWYNLPNIATGENPEEFEGFNTVEGVGYNIFPRTAGRIVSGRVLDIDGKPAAAAKVSLAGLSAETSETGVYAFIVPAAVSSGAYEVRAESADGQYVGTVSATVGAGGENSWGNDMALARPAVRIGERIFSTLDQALDAATNGNELVEILRPTVLRSSRTLTVDCTLKTAAGVDPAANAVRLEKDATLSVASGARVLFENVILTNAAGHVEIAVAKGGTAAVSGFVGVSAFTTQDAAGFELAGDLTGSFVLDCKGVTAARAVIGTVTAPPGASAGDIRNRGDEELGAGIEDGKLVWTAKPVEEGSAVATLVQDGVTTHYLSLRTLFRYVTNEATVVVRTDCGFESAVTVSHNLTITSADGCVITNLPTAGFTVGAGTMTLTNITFRGYRGEGLFLVNGEGAALVLKDGARLEDLIGTTEGKSGAISVWQGSATLESSSLITGCSAMYGGAIYLFDESCTLNLLGGTIIGCSASAYGGGVFAEFGSMVRVAGDVVVRENVGTESGDKADDIFLNDAFALVIVGTVTSPDRSIGVRIADPESGFGNGEGELFANVEGGVDPDSAAKFFCDVPSNGDDTLIGAPTPDGKAFAWMSVGKVVDPADAAVAVIFANGTTNYYLQIDDAIRELESPATIEVLKDSSYTKPGEARHDLTIRSAAGGPYALTRAGAAAIRVTSGASLTLSDVTFAGDGRSHAASFVAAGDGASLRLMDGAVIRDADCGNYPAVSVDTATFAMDPGAAILNCRNTADDGHGGGLWAAEGAVVELRGGVISNCTAATGGGAYFDFGSVVSISNGVTVFGNVGRMKGPDGQVQAPDVFAYDETIIRLVGELSGRVGVAVGRGLGADEDGAVFGSASGDYVAASDAEAVAVSAAGFTRGATTDFGCIVTNAERTLLVWRSALAVDGEERAYYESADGRLYRVGTYEPLTPDPEPVFVDPDPVAFTSIGKVDDVWVLVATNAKRGCWYSLWTGTTPRTNDFILVEGTSNRWTEADGPITNLVPVVGSEPARFWQIRAAPGEVPAP